MVPLKYLMIGIANHFQIVVDESFMNGNRYRKNLHLRFQVGKDDMQPFQLFRVFGENENTVILFFIFLQIFDQQIELPVEGRLYNTVIIDFMMVI